MKKIIILLIFIISAFGNSQNGTLQTKLDSILKEADLLYNYEKVAWNSTDLAMSLERVKNDYGGYIIYHTNDSIYASIIDISQKHRLIKYSYDFNNINVPANSNTDKSELSDKEKKLLDIKYKIIDQLSDRKYEVGFPEGFNPNLVLIQNDEEIKLYIIMGTSEAGVIPFGNDYLFTSDLEGNITSWKKFHSRLIPVRSKTPTGDIVTSATHSHLRTTPYITATDICTFRLYASYTELTEFKVYSPELGKNMKYYLESNTIEVIEKKY
jgi:hypothetical protein